MFPRADCRYTAPGTKKASKKGSNFVRNLARLRESFWASDFAYFSFVIYNCEIRAHVFFCDSPLGFIKFGKVCISFVLAIDVRKNHEIGQGNGLSVNFDAATDVNFTAIGSGFFNGLIQGPRHIDLLGIGHGAAHDNVRTMGQRFAANRFKGFATHDNGVVEGGTFEVLEVFGNMPRHFVFVADDPVFV